MKNNVIVNIDKQDFISFFDDIKNKVFTAQQKAILAVNSELVILYWEIGNTILQNQISEGWGSKVIDSLSKELNQAFPLMKGFSVRNLKYMRQFASIYADKQFVQEVLAQLSWYNNLTLMQKVKDDKVRKWYVVKSIENGWSQAVLVHQIESNLYGRSETKKLTNFTTTLQPSHSEMVEEVIKDPYIFDFLTLSEKVKEKDIEMQLVKHITEFLLELGVGFAFVGKQYRLEIGDKEYFIDLLFYHLKLRCYFVIELKNVAFKPEFAGKLNFYLSAVDDIIKSDTDNPTIGLILCKSKDKIEAEYALRDINKPIGISEYQITKSLPNDLKSTLPSIEEIEEKLEND
jgi:predicted nuclease of restriction endonuclease-like (RecB) superfamily